jgi:AcrR family transcriptional regulator
LARARRRSKVERRLAILRAARKVFCRAGYSATRMIDVAVEAKVGKGTLYEYFSSKEDLFSTLVLVVMRDALETLGRRTVAADPVEALRDTIAFTVEVALAENLDLYRLFYDFWGVSASTRRDTQQRLREVSGSYREFVVQTVRRGQKAGVFRPEVDPVQFGHAFSSAIDGLSLQLVIVGEQIDLAAYTSHLQDLFLGGLTAPGALDGASVLKEKQ